MVIALRAGVFIFVDAHPIFYQINGQLKIIY